MIRLNPEALALLKSAPGSGFGRNGVARLRVLDVSGKTVTISLDGLRLKAVSDIPLHKGDVFMVRQQAADGGMRLKILSRGIFPDSGTNTGLQTLLEEDPALAKALINAGLRLSEERIDRFRRRLQGKSGPERDEAARELALWEEKHSGYWGVPIGFPRESDRQQHGEGENGEIPSRWTNVALNPAEIARILKRRSAELNSYQLFNHTPSGEDYHWLRLPFRVKLHQQIYRGELRINLGLSEGSPQYGALKLEGEFNPQDIWKFHLEFSGKGRIDLVEAPEHLLEKGADLTEKVRKVGFNIVDTLNRAFDGYTYQTDSVVKGFDAEV